jgi:integration host factor subunit beta
MWQGHAGKRIKVRGFGSFEVREYDGHIARNPKSGVKIEVKPNKLPFKDQYRSKNRLY